MRSSVVRMAILEWSEIMVDEGEIDDLERSLQRLDAIGVEMWRRMVFYRRTTAILAVLLVAAVSTLVATAVVAGGVV